MVTSSLRLRSNRSRRSRISRAALFVNVTASICQGLNATLADQVRDAVGDDPSLARTGTGNDQERAFRGDDGLLLGFVQALEDCRSAARPCGSDGSVIPASKSANSGAGPNRETTPVPPSKAKTPARRFGPARFPGKEVARSWTGATWTISSGAVRRRCRPDRRCRGRCRRRGSPSACRDRPGCRCRRPRSGS